jgi:DNA excision repair protein ERCC-8
MRLCDMKSGAFSHTLIGHKADVWTLAWSPRSEYMLASGSVDQTIRVWDIRRAGCLMVLDQHNDASAFVNQKYLSGE